MAGILKNRWLRWLAILVPSLFFLGFGYYQNNYPTCTFRYKLTAEVMTPEGLKTGSSAIEVSYIAVDSILPDARRIKLNAKGEAIFIRLSDKMYFVLSLSGEDPVRKGRVRNGWASKYLEGALNIHELPVKVLDFPRQKLPVFGSNSKVTDFICEQIAEKKKQNLVLPVSSEYLPVLLVFKDINDPNSVTYVQPGDLASFAGPGFELKQVTFQLTDEPPTQNGLDWITWWDAKIEAQKKIGSFGSNTSLIDILLDGAFRRPGIWGNNQ